MRDIRLDLCRRYADAHVDRSGVAVTPVPVLTIIRALHPGELQAAYTVGYASVSPFTREYARMFGAPPGRDKRMATVRVLFDV